jgi:hypothetical protein
MNSFECRHARREIDEMEFGRQPAERVSAHLATCAPCRDFHAERIKLREMVASLEPVIAPADFDMRLRARIAREKSPRQSQPFFARLLSTPALAATALFVLVTGSVVWISQRQTTTPVTAPKSVAAKNGGTPTVNPTNSPASNAEGTETSPVGPDVIAQAGTTVPRRNRSTTRSVRSQDFNVEPVDSVRQSDADQAYVNAPSKPVVFSLEDERGETRKISLPPVTFGAQNLSGNRMAVSYSPNSRVW